MPLVVYTTLDDETAARTLARGAVERRLAACVHIARIDSVYRWDGGVQEDPEWRLMFKVGDAAYDRLAAYILDAHPYDEPALWAVRIDRGASGFLDWIDAETSGKG